MSDHIPTPSFHTKGQSGNSGYDIRSDSAKDLWYNNAGSLSQKSHSLKKDLCKSETKSQTSSPVSDVFLEQACTDESWQNNNREHQEGELKSIQYHDYQKGSAFLGKLQRLDKQNKGMTESVSDQEPSCLHIGAGSKTEIPPTEEKVQNHDLHIKHLKPLSCEEDLCSSVESRDDIRSEKQDKKTAEKSNPVSDVSLEQASAIDEKADVYLENTDTEHKEGELKSLQEHDDHKGSAFPDNLQRLDIRFKGMTENVSDHEPSCLHIGVESNTEIPPTEEKVQTQDLHKKHLKPLSCNEDLRSSVECRDDMKSEKQDKKTVETSNPGSEVSHGQACAIDEIAAVYLENTHKEHKERELKSLQEHDDQKGSAFPDNVQRVDIRNEGMTENVSDQEPSCLHIGVELKTEIPPTDEKVQNKDLRGSRLVVNKDIVFNAIDKQEDNLQGQSVISKSGDNQSISIDVNSENQHQNISLVFHETPPHTGAFQTADVDHAENGLSEITLSTSFNCSKMTPSQYENAEQMDLDQLKHVSNIKFLNENERLETERAIRQMTSEHVCGVTFKEKKLLNFEKIQVKKIVGTGGYGQVWLCCCGDFEFACKKVNVPPKFRIQEVEVLFKARGKYLPKLYAAVHINTVWYILMKYIPQTLKDVKHKLRSDKNYLKMMLYKVIKAVDQLKNDGNVHTDIKDVNIGIDENDEVILLDVGSVWTIEDTSHDATKGGTTAETMSPLQFQSKPDKNCDIYGVACTFLMLLTDGTQLDHCWDPVKVGRGENHYTLHDLISKYGRNEPSVPELCDLLMRMVEYNPNDRITPCEALTRNIFKEFQKKRRKSSQRV